MKKGIIEKNKTFLTMTFFNILEKKIIKTIYSTTIFNLKKKEYNWKFL